MKKSKKNSGETAGNATSTSEKDDSIVARFFIPGIPKPGGSKTAQPIYVNGKLVVKKDGPSKGRPVILYRDASDNLAWKNAIRLYAMQYYRGPLLDGPIKFSVEFVMPRPRHHYKSNGELKPGAPKYHTIKPDVLKLARCIEDALTGILWQDDCLIVQEIISKQYGDVPGAYMAAEVVK